MRPRGASLTRAAIFGVTLTLALSALLMAVPGGSAQPIRPSFTTVSATLHDQKPSIGPVPPNFWGLSAHTATPTGILTDSGVTTFLQNSPAHFLRYGQSADQCDIATSTLWVPGANNHYKKSTSGCPMNIADFATECAAMPTPCTSIIQLPGVQNDSQLDAYEANYVVNTLGFQPTYWAIGNEPMNSGIWLNYGLNWSSWLITGTQTFTTRGYAIDVQNAIAAIENVDPAAQFIGVEAAYYGDTSLFDMVGQYDAAEIAAVAYHTYPKNGVTSTTQFYSVLQSSTNLTNTYGIVVNDMGTVPVEVGEYNHGPGVPPAPSQDGQFPDAVFTAASITQALRAGIPALQFFTLQTTDSTFGYGLLNPSDAIDPAGLVYQDMLGSGNFQKYGGVNNTTVSTTATSVYAAMIRNTSNCYNGLIVADTDVTNGVSLALNHVFPQVASGGTISWFNSSLSVPKTVHGAVGSPIVMEPNSVLVVKDQTCGKGLAPAVGLASPGAMSSGRPYGLDPAAVWRESRA